MTSAQQACPESLKPVDTGAYRWVALLLVWGGFLLSYVDRVAWATISANVGQTLGIEVALLGAFVTAFYAGYVLANIIGGIVTDWLGGRVVLSVSLLLLGIFTYGFGYTKSLTMGIVIQLCMGLAAGADYSAGMKIIPTWFHRDRGRAMGLYTTATSLAVVLANALAPSFREHYGWVALFHTLGFVTMLWGVVTVLFLKNRPSGQAPERTTMADMLSLLRNRNLIVLSIAGFGGMWATIGINAWGNALMTKGHGLSLVLAGSIMAGFGVGAVIAKPLLGMIADIQGVSRKWLAFALFLALIVVLLIFGQCASVTQFYIVAPALGVFSYGYLPVILAQISDTSGRRLAGAAGGWTNAIFQAGSVISPLVVGFAYGRTHIFLLSFVVLAIGPAASALAMLTLKPGPRVL